MTQRNSLSHSTDSTTVADLLERVLDKGLVISGDIRVKLVDVELLTIELRLLICSVDKAVEMGVDWWRGNPAFAPHDTPSIQHDTQSIQQPPAKEALIKQEALEQRIQLLEQQLASAQDLSS